MDVVDAYRESVDAFVSTDASADATRVHCPSSAKQTQSNSSARPPPSLALPTAVPTRRLAPQFTAARAATPAVDDDADRAHPARIGGVDRVAANVGVAVGLL